MTPTHPIHHQDTKDTKVSRINPFVLGMPDFNEPINRSNWQRCLSMIERNTGNNAVNSSCCWSLLVFRPAGRIRNLRHLRDLRFLLGGQAKFLIPHS
jgi:hypothetical protein